MQPVTLYTTEIEPDCTSALDVLAFCLIPVAAFLDGEDTADTKREVMAILEDARRAAIARWWASRNGGGVTGGVWS